MSKSSKYPPQSLALDFDGNAITLDRFEKAIESFFAILRNVSKEITKGDKPIQWEVKVKSGSNVVIARVMADALTQRNAETVLDVIPGGLRLLETGTQESPKYFNTDAIKAARDLVSLRDRQGKNISYIKIRRDGVAQTLSRKLIESVNDIVGGQHQAYGSIQGKLQTLSDRGGFKFFIYDELFDQKVTCFVTEELMPIAVKSFTKRVAVYGLVQYNKAGDPCSLKVEQLDIFRNNSDLTPLDKIAGILKEA